MNDAYDTACCPPAQMNAAVRRDHEALMGIGEWAHQANVKLAALQTDTRTVRDILMARYEQAVVEMKRRQADIDLLPASVLDMKAEEARRLFGAIF